MKLKVLVVLILLGLIVNSCKHESQQCLVVPMALQILDLKVRIVDKTTGADLFLSPTSPYKQNDLTINSAPLTNYETFVDSTKKDDRFINLILRPESQSLILKLASLSADTINTTTSDITNGCTSTTVLNSVKLDGKVICSPCSTSQAVTIMK